MADTKRNTETEETPIDAAPLDSEAVQASIHVDLRDVPAEQILEKGAAQLLWLWGLADE